MSIFKESFPSHIKTQLLKRGEAIARRGLSDLVIHNGSKAWIRMSSSVDVKGDSGALAKNYVLVGGALYNGKLRSGVGVDASNAYSLQTPSGKTHLYGVRPMPGITGVEVKSKGAYGSLREVTINFNCWDITQLEDLELLYMRPGYSVLLEWGWIPYINNDGALVSSPSSFNIFDSNLNGKDYQNVFQQLFKLEEEAHGNYGGFLGIIKNYKWSARPDGGYDCTTTLISIGEMIESLKINYNATNLSLIQLSTSGYLQIKNSARVPDPDYLEKFYQRNFLSGLIYELHESIPSENYNQTFTVEDKFGVKYDLFSMDIELHDETEEMEEMTTGDGQVFISLESFCKLINNHITVGIVAEDGNKPIVGVTTSDRPYQNGGQISAENLKNPTSPYLLCLCHPLQISVDPSICLIRNDIWGSFKLPEGLGSTESSEVPATTGDPGKQVDANINFNGSLTPAETAAKTTINEVIAEITGKSDSDEKFIVNSLKKYFDACKAAGVNEDKAASELSRQFELAVTVSKKVVDADPMPVVSIGGKSSYSNEQLYDFLDTTLDEDDELIPISLGLKNLKGKDLGIIKARKAAITTQIKTEEKVEEIKDKQDDAEADLSFMSGLKNFSVSDANGTADLACKAGLGQIGNIFINLRYLLRSSKDPGLEGSDKNGKNTINLYDFLKKMLTDISTATGNVNNFDIHVDPIDSIARIIDVNFVDTQNKKSAYDNTFTFYSENGTPTGKYNGLKSIVRNYSLESQIFSEQSSIVAIGAQTGGGQLGLENDTMVGFNQGVKDRLKPQTNAMNTTKDQNSSGVQLENLLTNLTPIYEFIGEMGGNEADLYLNEVSKYEGALRDTIALFRALSKNPIKFKAIIPTKLTLEIDGISNLIIGHMFNIHPDLLPKGYKTDGEEVGRRLGYILTGIGHTVNDNGWVTKLEGQTIILEEPDGEEKNLFDVTLTKVDNKEKVEKVVTKIKSDGKGNVTADGKDWEGKMRNEAGGRIESEAVTTQNFSKKWYPGYKFTKGTSDINLSKGGLRPLTESEIIDETYKNRFNLGKLKTPVPMFVVHHTAGHKKDGSNSVYRTFYDRGYPAQYVIDGNGKIYRFMPDGAIGWQAKGYNSKSMGVEVQALKDSDVSMVQVQAAARLIHYLGFKKDQIVGHGQISKNKQATEGKTIVDYIKNNL